MCDAVFVFRSEMRSSHLHQGRIYRSVKFPGQLRVRQPGHLPLQPGMVSVEFLFVHSFYCRKAQNACIFLLSGKKVNGQIRTLLYNTKAMKTKTKWKKIPFSQTGLATVGFMSTLAVEQIPSDLDFPDCKYCKTHELP